MGTRSTAMSVRHASIFPYSMSFESALLVRDAVNMHRTVATLSRNILVHRIPGDTLNIM